MAFSPENFPWHEWICHTNYSFLTGSSHPREFVETANTYEYSSLGITDYDGVYGIVKAYTAFKELNKTQSSALQSLSFGIEYHLKPDHKLPVSLQDTIILKAQNLKGYETLCRLTTKSFQRQKQHPWINLHEILNVSKEGMICIQPMRGIIRHNDFPALLNRYQNLKEAFGDRFYLLISRHLSPLEDRWIRTTLDLATKLKIGILFSQDSYFHCSQRKRLNDVMHAIRHNQSIYDCQSQFFPNAERSLRDKQTIWRRYSPIPNFEYHLEHSDELHQSFDFCLSQIRYYYPKEMIPEGFDAQSYLESLVWSATYGLYPQPPEKLKRQLKKELILIQKLEFADYFLTVWDIVKWARDRLILCQGRGSAANSAICYVLGITAVDPTLFDLLFERFISLERGDPPDIDVDFEHERREEVIQYIYQRYGRHKAAMVANIISFRGKSALRSVGKALQIPDSAIDLASKQQKTRFYRKSDCNTTIEAVHEKHTRKDIPWELWSQLSEEIKGFPRHLGLHSGGFIISQHNLNTISPIEPATMANRSVIQWSKDDIEELGLFKIDILALGMLTAIRKSLSLVRNHYNQPIHLNTIPQEDKSTYHMIQRAQTLGTFQIESRAQMSMLPRLRPHTFYDLVVQIGIIRPGPIQGGLIHPYLKRRQGLEAVSYPHPKLKPILQRTLGVPIFQEQIMRVAMTVGDFSPGEADKLRKQIGSWSLRKDMLDMIQKLQSGMKKHGIRDHHIRQIVGYLKGFSEYGFPESHAASFALLAYASAYLKCHFPAAFYCGLINAQPMGFYSVHAILQEAKRDGITIKPISILQSQYDCSLESSENNPHKSQLSIRLGFRLVHGLSKSGALKLISKRDNSTRKMWQSLSDFLHDQILNRADLMALSCSNAFADFNINRRSAIWLGAAAPIASFIEDKQHYDFEEISDLDNNNADFKSFGTSLGPHPAKLIKAYHWQYEIPVKQVKTATQIAHLRANQLIVVFGMVLVRQAPSSAKGMVFVTLEDDTGLINLAFTPVIYKQFHDIIDDYGFLCIQGRLQSANHSHSILVKKVYQAQLSHSNLITLHQAKEARKMFPKSDLTTKKQLTKARNYI